MMGFSISRIISRAWGHVALSVLIGIGLVSLIAPSCAFAATSVPFTINMSEAVTVTGTPRIAVDVGGVTRYATYTSGSGSAALVFTYAMVAGDVDLDGVSLSSPIDLNGGTITDLNGNPQTDLTFTVPNTSGVKIDYPSLSMDFIYDADGRYTLNGTAYNDLTSFLGASGGTFSRASIGTYFDSSGTLQTASSGTPRFDHDPVTHAPKGILIEEARTNLALRSENFATWNAYLATKTANTTDVTDLRGGNTAAKVVYNASNAQISQTITVTEGVTYTASIWVKGSGTVLFALLQAGGSYSTYASSGTVTLTNEWKRLNITGLKSVDGFPVGFYLFPGTGATLYMWGAQLEAGTFPTSYIPTTTAAVTRAAETLSMPTGGWYNASEGTVSGEYTPTGVGAGSVAAQYYFFSAFVNLDIVTSRVWPSGDMNFVCGDNTGVIVSNIYGASGLSLGTPISTAQAFKLNDFAFSVNGGSIASDTSGIMPLPTKLSIGSSTVSQRANGTTQIFKYYPARVSNTQLQLMTQ